MRISSDVLDLIGNTPMVRLRRTAHGVKANVLVKLEYLNPSGSLKDRIALRMIEEAERDGSLKPGYTIVEGSTGNTGISLSLVGALKGYKVVIYMPERVSEERIKMMRRYGAEVQIMSAEEERELKERSVSGAEIEVPLRIKCLEVERSTPKVWWARQFSNSANVKAHNRTGQEIMDQVDGRVDVFVASVGTGGTIMGVAEVLKSRFPRARVVAIEPASSMFPLISGYRKVPGASPEVSGGIIAEMLDKNLVDNVVQVKDEDAINMAHRLTREEGLFAGISSGANVLIAIREALKLGKDRNVVTVLPDNMDRYLSEEHYTT